MAELRVLAQETPLAVKVVLLYFQLSHLLVGAAEEQVVVVD
jgi:hypothetical protein